MVYHGHARGNMKEKKEIDVNIRRQEKRWYY
jgi:hypothetical protein